MKCMKNEGLRDHTRGEMHNLGRNPSGKDEKSKKRVFGGREIAFLSRRNEKEWIWFCIGAIYRNCSSMGRGFVEICRWQNHLDGSKSCREVIGQIETFLMDRESVEKLSRQIPDSFDGMKMR